MDSAATSEKPKREWPRIPPNYVSLRDLQELRRREKEEQERLQRQREVEAAANTEKGRGSSEKKPWGGGQRSRGGKQWAPVAHRAMPPPTPAEGATEKVEVMAVAIRVAPSSSPQGVAKKTDPAIGVLAVARPEAPPPPPPRWPDAAKKREGEIGGRAIKKGPDESAASAFQAGAKLDRKGKGNQPIALAETATVSSPGGSPDDKKGKGKRKGKASADQETAPVTTPVAPAEVIRAPSSQGRGKPANNRNRKKSGVGMSTVWAAPIEATDASPPCAFEPQDKGKKKPSDGRRAGAAPIGNSPDGKATQAAQIRNSSELKGAQPSPALAADLSSNRRIWTPEEMKSECVVAKPPLVEGEAPARAAKIVVRSARPPFFGGRRQQHAGEQNGGGVWVPKVVAPATPQNSGWIRKNN
uniref:Uncharacterized protein n=1 Tax=Leersia perrieri TaxID=77586 RepID=A0A0D9VXR3_9ORYZ